MIRNVVVGRVREGVPAEQVEAALEALRTLTVEGVDFRLVGGQDRGLRDGNAHFALTADFVSEDAYKIYDDDPEHNRLRRDLIAPIAESVERIQFALPE